MKTQNDYVSISRKPLIVLRLSIGIIYLCFGILKFFNGSSPAEQLAVNTIYKLTGGILSPNVSIFLLALWETVSGIFLITGIKTKRVLQLLILHLICTFTPLLFFPQLSFNSASIGFTLLGQYIVKNIVLLSSILVLLYARDKRK